MDNKNLLKIRPAWVEVDINNSLNNINEVKRITGKKVCAVIKANAYGLGVINIAKEYLKNGVDYFAVAVLSEATELRKEIKDLPILVLGYTPEYLFEEAIEKDIVLTIYNYEHAIELSKVAVKLGKTANIHIKVDSGMSRIGFLPKEESIDDIIAISELDNISIEGIYTHFAKADEENKDSTNRQATRFEKVIRDLHERGLEIPIKHAANSATIIDSPEYYYDMVRPGIILTGSYPSDEVKKENMNLKIVGSLKAKIANVKTIDEGEGVGYGHKFVADKKTVVGTLPLGYADGFFRNLSQKIHVMYKGVKCPLIGRICMDQCMIDLTNVEDPHIGDEVTIYGDKESGACTQDDIANIVGTISYEVLTSLSRRLPRVYVKDNEVIEVVEYIK